MNDPSQAKILRTKPTLYIAAGVAVMFIFFGGLAAWSAFFPFRGAVIASGSVKVSNERKTVQHLEGGIIDKILVREGDIVDKGDVLIKLQSAQVNAEVDLLQGRLWAKLAERSRLFAETTMAEDIMWEEELLQKKDIPEVESVMDKETQIFQSRRKDLLGKIDLHRSQMEQVREQIKGAQEELAAQEEIIAKLQEELQAKESLLKEKYIDKAQILELGRRAAEHKGRKGRLKQTIAESRQKIEELKLQIVNLRNEYQEKSVTELSKVNNTIFELREQLQPKLDAQRRLKITAPVAGEVLNMQVHSEGGVIKSGQPVLDIVPTDSELIIEARIRRQDITNVEVGQDVKVQLSAFNRRTTPPLPGEVTYVSADQLTQETGTGQQSFYIAHVHVQQDALQGSGAYLSPGMPAVCYIATEKRTIFEYLTDPIFEVMDKALRES
jgi:HlyD family type I secretion membrane fusion protein